MQKGLFCKNGSMGWSCWTGLVPSERILAVCQCRHHSVILLLKEEPPVREKKLVHDKGKKSSRKENSQAKLGLDVKPQFSVWLTLLKKMGGFVVRMLTENFLCYA